MGRLPATGFCRVTDIWIDDACGNKDFSASHSFLVPMPLVENAILRALPALALPKRNARLPASRIT